MLFKQLVRTLGYIVLAISPALAQQPQIRRPARSLPSETQKANEQRALALLDEVVANAQSLKLVPNRLRILVTAANMIWPHNEGRARNLLEAAVKEFIELVSAIDESDPEFYNAIQAPAQLHALLVQTLIERDPKLALDFIHRAHVPQPPQQPSKFTTPNHEVQLELQIASQIVRKDPELALRTALDSLDKGVSSSITGVLLQLRSTNPDGTLRLATALTRKLLSENLLVNNDAASVAVEMVRTGVRHEERESVDGKPLVSRAIGTLIDPGLSRELENRVLIAALTIPIGHTYSDWRERNIAQTLLTGLEPSLPRIRETNPSRAAALQSRIKQFRATMDTGTRFWQENQDVLSNGSVDDVLALASNLPPEMLDQLYQQAAWKALGQGDMQRAKQIISEKISNPMYRRQMGDEIDRQAATRAAAEGKLEQARLLISRLRTDEERVRMLIQLAMSLSNKDDVVAAHRVLDEARAMTAGKAESSRQIQAKLELARAYSRIDARTGLEIVEPLIPQLNDLLGAAEVLNGFDHQFYKDGELIWQGSGLSNLVSQVIGDLEALAPEHFDGASDLAGRFQRPEVRLSAQLVVAQAVLSERSRANYGIDDVRVIGSLER